MNIMSVLYVFRNYVITFIVFLAIDMIWLTQISKTLYKKHLGYLMASKVNVLAAFVFYMIFIVGVMVFVLYPALEKGDWKIAVFGGMLFGFVTYATYDLTNLATIKDWPILITIVDLIWGSAVTAMTAIASYSIIRLFHVKI